jgi:hypothetical protein
MSDIKDKFKNVSSSLFTKLSDTIKYIIKNFYHLLNDIINSTRYIASLLIIIFIILIVLINLTNISGKNIQILVLAISGILLSIFYFFIYRKEFSADGNGTKAFPLKNGILDYNNYYENRKIVTGDKKFDSANFKKTVSIPILNLLKFTGFLIGTIVALVLLLVFIWYSFNENEYLFRLTKTILGIGIMISVLSIIMKTFSITLNNYPESKNILIQILSLIKNLVLFLPCMLLLMVEELNKDIKATPGTTISLFILLLILVLSFMGIPLLFKFLTSLNKYDLLGGKGPYYLDKRRVIGKYQDFSKDYKSSLAKISPKSSSYALLDENEDHEFNIKAITGYVDKDKFKYNYTYSVSFYLYLNPQPQNTSLAYNKETELFNYGNKPVILYDGRNRNLVIKSKTQTGEGSQLDTIYKTKNIKYQKWMFITINYKDNMIDVFIDGKIVGSKKNVPPYFGDDKITIGEDNGIHGSIKDIYYFDTIRPASNTEFIHNLTTNK